MVEAQAMLSRFDAGDVSNRDLSTETRERRRFVEEYAREVTAGGWSLVLVTEETVGWHNPDGPGVFRLICEAGRWRGEHARRKIGSSFEDLQDALDWAGEFLAKNPVEDGDSS